MMEDQNRYLAEMVAVATEYCELIEHLDEAGSDWLEQLARLLPRLHAAVEALPDAQDRSPTLVPPDLDLRFELFTRLAQRLGTRDGYWLEYDGMHGAEQMTGSLADDFTDIYFDLRSGLDAMRGAGRERAVAVWRSGYQIHWGQHLVDAERQLYTLRVSNRLAAD